MNDIGFFGDGMGGGMGFGGFFMILFWGLIILGIITAFKWVSGNSTGAGKPAQKTAQDMLKERYARGEIDEQEYQRKWRDLEQ